MLILYAFLLSPLSILLFLSSPTLIPCVHSEDVTVMLRHVFETNQPSNPVEEMVRAAASGDTTTVNEVGIVMVQVGVPSYFLE